MIKIVIIIIIIIIYKVLLRSRKTIIHDDIIKEEKHKEIDFFCSNGQINGGSVYSFNEKMNEIYNTEKFEP